MSHGEIEIPYEIKAYTKGEIDDTCSETGVVTVSNFFKADEVPSSYFSKWLTHSGWGSGVKSKKEALAGTFLADFWAGLRHWSIRTSCHNIESFDLF